MILYDHFSAWGNSPADTGIQFQRHDFLISYILRRIRTCTCQLYVQVPTCFNPVYLSYAGPLTKVLQLLSEV